MSPQLCNNAYPKPSVKNIPLFCFLKKFNSQWNVTSSPNTTPPHTLSPTEKRSKDSSDLDTLNTLERLQLLNTHDRSAIDAVRNSLPRLATLVDEAASRVRKGGTIHYFGAGTPGRLAVLDAAELIPTFGIDRNLVTAHIAGGSRALTVAVEDSEDSDSDGAEAAHGLGQNDVAIGVTASGSTPYVGGALQRAREQGALTALITSNPEPILGDLSEIVMSVATGPEVLTGSTRLSAGTAQKAILSSFSTALMIALGRTYSNLMVSVIATNAKLRERTVRILVEAGAEPRQAQTLLEAARGELPTAIVSLLAQVEVPLARRALEAADGSVHHARLALIDHPESHEQ